MRLGGPFPFGQGAIVIDLPGGGVFGIPQGNWIVTLGAQTVLQWFDPVLLTWRALAATPGTVLDGISVDGYNYRLVNASGVAVGASITAAGSGGVNGIGAAATGGAVSFGAAPANGVAAAAYPIVGGSINTTIAITQAGSGFLVPPMILLDPPPQGGIQATARCTISAGAINAVTVDNAGAGYLTAPTAYVVPQYPTYEGIGVPVNPAGPPSIIPPGLIGSAQPSFLDGYNWPLAVPSTGGALLTVNATLTGSGTLTGLVMTNYGAGYTGTTIPTVTITGVGAATATALMSMALQSITITSGGVAYSADTHIAISNYGLLSAATNLINNSIVGPRVARARATQSGGVINATVIEDAGFGFQTVPRLGVIATSGTPPTTVANLTAVVGGVNDISVIQPAAQ